MPLIDDKMKQELVDQLGMEKYNANLYLRVANFLRSKGLEHYSKFFEDQHTEETSHSLMIYKLLTDLGEQFMIPEIPEVVEEFDTMLDVAELFLEAEINTTNSLDRIRHDAASQSGGGYPVVEMLMQEMLHNQQAELDESSTLLDTVTTLGNDWKFVLLLDASMGKE
jgi:ferritin